MLLSKPQLASKIRKYQNETDINTPNDVALTLLLFSKIPLIRRMLP
jgi:hypothetical protein